MTSIESTKEPLSRTCQTVWDCIASYLLMISFLSLLDHGESYNHCLEIPWWSGSENFGKRRYPADGKFQKKDVGRQLSYSLLYLIYKKKLKFFQCLLYYNLKSGGWSTLRKFKLDVVGTLKGESGLSQEHGHWCQVCSVQFPELELLMEDGGEFVLLLHRVQLLNSTMSFLLL